MSTPAFSSNGSAVIQRSTESFSNLRTENCDLPKVYEIKRCIDWIRSNLYQRTALQFPDELLADAATVTNILQAGCDGRVFILGDTSYGSCCVDCVAAQHYNADSIIHFGRSCLSPTQHLPVLWVFGQQLIDVNLCQESFIKLFPERETKILVLYDVVYHHAMEKLTCLFKETHPELVLSSIDDTVLGSSSKSEELSEHHANVVRCFNRTCCLASDSKLADYKIFYVGAQSSTLTNFMMFFNQSQFFSYDPVTKVGQKETLQVNKKLMRRYYMIEKAKDAEIVGILAGTLGVSDYLTVIQQLKDTIAKAGKRSYSFVVGKINVPKLANFMEIDVFVLVACPENTLFDSEDFYRPVVTPFEMEIACNQAREWTGDYVTDFRQLLPGAAHHVPTEEQEFRQDVSLITGEVRRLGVEKKDEEVLSPDGTLVKVEGAVVAAKSAAEYLQHREWRGLEENLGQTPVVKAVEGLKGIAGHYDGEPHDS